MSLVPREVSSISSLSEEPTPAFKDNNVTVYAIPIAPTTSNPEDNSVGHALENSEGSLKRPRSPSPLPAGPSKR
jgi:hypothetical protein